MTKKETVAMFGLIAALYPRDTKFTAPDATMRDAWAEMLADIPFEAAKAALKAAVSTSPFPPSISEIRDYATRKNRRMTADEAWAIAAEVMREYGTRTVPIEGYKPKAVVVRFGERVNPTPSGLEYEAKRHCPPEVWEHLRRMGYADICVSENIDTIRAQFRKAWNAHDREEYEKRVISGVLPELYGGNKENGGTIHAICCAVVDKA